MKRPKHSISSLDRKKLSTILYVCPFLNTLPAFANVKFLNGKIKFVKINSVLNAIELKTKHSICSFSFLMHSWSVTGRGGKDFLAGICSNRLTVYKLKTNTMNKE